MLQIQYQLTPNDVLTIRRKVAPWPGGFLWCVICLMIGFSIFEAFHAPSFNVWLSRNFIVILIVVYFLFVKIIPKKLLPELGPTQTLTLHPESLAWESADERYRVYWGKVAKITTDVERINFRINQLLMYVVPRRAFADQAASDEFLALSQNYHQNPPPIQQFRLLIESGVNRPGSLLHWLEWDS